MKKLLTLFILFPALMFSQQGITFQIEELEKPKDRLGLTHIDNYYKNLITRKLNINAYELKDKGIDFPYSIVAQSNSTDSVVSLAGFHSIFMGMYQAYADHRPFVLSPDMVWLLISQGFANHVKYNSDKLRSHFVNFDGKLSLIVHDNRIDLNNPDSPWEVFFPEFTKQIGKYAGEDLAKVMTANFSTTTVTTKVASEITLMKAMEDYFEYIIFYVACGIPGVTLEGTPEDWQKVLDKARFLKKYKLEWWINEIEPVLEEIVKTSKGKIDKKFWQQMFKYHTQKKYGKERVFNGWIVKFFPYDKDGNRNNLKKIDKLTILPNDIVNVDLEYVKMDENGNVLETAMLELWGGFTGLTQNEETFALKPEIGWMIRKKNTDSNIRKKQFETNNSEKGFGLGIQIRVDRVPKEILEMKQIASLHLDFIREINIPDEMARIEIKNLILNGEISELGIERLCKMFPNTYLLINHKTYNKHLEISF